MARITGRLLTLTVDGEDKASEVSRAIVTSGEADSDFISFADAAAGGGREYKLALTMAQDTGAGSLWTEIFDNVGDQVPFTIAPHGNTTPSVEEPHYEGTAVVSEPDGDWIGGEANPSTTAVLTTEVEWSMIGRPVKVTA